MPYHVGTSEQCPASKPHAVIKDSDGEVMGCHASQEDAGRQIAAIHASEGAAVTTPVPVATPSVTGESYASTMAGTPWDGVLAVEGVETGDGREFVVGALTWEDPATTTIPLRWNIQSSHGGEPRTVTVDVGRITQIWRDADNPAIIRGSGVFDDEGENGAEALRQVRSGFLSGISIDPDNIKNADVELVYANDVDEAFHLPGKHNQADHGGARSRALNKKALDDAKRRGQRISTPPPGGGRRGPSYAGEEPPPLEPDDQEPDIGDDDIMKMFMPPSKTVFHAGRIRAATLVSIPAFVEAKIQLTQETPTPEDDVAEHFTSWTDEAWSPVVAERLLSENPLAPCFAHVGTTHRESQFLHHTIEGHEVGAANVAACESGIRALVSSRVTGLSYAERRRAYEHLAAHLRVAGHTPEPFTYEVPQSALVAALDEMVGPPREWFDVPEPPGYQAIRVEDVTASGWRLITGHGAAWGTCHTSFPGACVTPPREGEHSYFRLGEVVCADGSRVAVGSVTMGTGHAATRGITASQAVEHYDNTGSVVALVASHEGKHGIWLSGAIPPWVSDDRVALMRGVGQVSGDWRRIGGKMRLVAFLAVPRPGFPVLRVGVHQGLQTSLVAAGTRPDPLYVDPGTKRAMEIIAKSIGRDPRSRAAEIRARIGR